jgi:hypothetical protein
VQDIDSVGNKVLARITTAEEYNAFVAFRRPDYFMCSSSLDFPEDSTKDANIIALCRAIRDNK